MELKGEAPTLNDAKNPHFLLFLVIVWILFWQDLMLGNSNVQKIIGEIDVSLYEMESFGTSF